MDPEELETSTTQAQLHDLHAAERNSSEELKAHLTLLQTLPCYSGTPFSPSWSSALLNVEGPHACCIGTDDDRSSESSGACCILPQMMIIRDGRATTFAERCVRLSTQV